MSKPRARTAGSLVALAAVLAACGSGTLGTQRPGQPSVSAKTAVLAAMGDVGHGSSYDFAMSVGISGFGQTPAALGGLFSGGDAPDGGLTYGYTGAYSGPQEALKVTMTGTAGATDSAVPDLTEELFLRTGAIYLQVTPGKWFELATGVGTSLSKLDAGLTSLAGDNPASFVGSVSQYVESVRQLGSEKVDGVATTEYAVTENLQKLMQKTLTSGLVGDLVQTLAGSGSPAGSANAASNAIDSAFAALPSTLTVDVFLDGTGHLRRLTASLPIGPLFSAVVAALMQSLGASMGAGSGLSSVSGTTGTSAQSEIAALDGIFAHAVETETMDLSDFGASVDITAPPASDVTHTDPLQDPSA